MGTLVRYLTPGERLIYSSRRHKVVLGNAFVVFGASIVLGIAASTMSHRFPGDHLGEIGAGITVLGAAFLAWRAGHWALTRYVITNERILLIEGLIARRITALPLRLVIDTTYRRTIWGRLLGYCNLELNLSGHPGLRSLTRVPNADRVYALILRLLSGHEDGAPAEPEPEPEREANDAMRLAAKESWVNDPDPDADRLYRLIRRLLNEHEEQAPAPHAAPHAEPKPEPEAQPEWASANDTVRMGVSDTTRLTHRLPPS
jgi:Bacterial PH domain